MNETDAMTTPRIIQMMPAEGWYAFFRDQEDDSLGVEPLVCFALTENSDGATEIRPMFWQGSYVDFADDYDNFEGVEQADLSEMDWAIEQD